MNLRSSPTISTHQLKSNQILRHFKTNQALRREDYKKSINENRHIVSLFDCSLNPQTGVVWSGKSIIEESSVMPAHKLFRWEPAPIMTKKLSDVILNLPDNGFYHFLIEDLPRFMEAYELYPKVKIITGSNSSYMQDIMKIFQIENYTNLEYPVQCQELILSEKALGGIFDYSDYNILRTILKSFESNNCGKKIFIARANLKKGFLDRGIKYSEQLYNRLENLGFEKIFLEELSISEQISVISSAEVLVGFHGAGLANMVWMNPNTQVFEITESRLTSHFEHIALICKIRFKRFIASELLELTDLQLKSKFIL